MKIQSFLVVFVLVAGSALAQEKPLTRAQVDFFEKKIRPVLVENCYKCHSAKSEKVKGELLLDTKAGARKLAHYVEREVTRLLAVRTGPIALPSEPAAQDAYADLATALRGGAQNGQPQVNPRMRG